MLQHTETMVLTTMLLLLVPLSIIRLHFAVSLSLCIGLTENEPIFQAQSRTTNPAPTVGAGVVRRFSARFPGIGSRPLFLRSLVLIYSSRTLFGARVFRFASRLSHFL